jgi:2-polyprenyl-3-methyl-5-hydroxy-6-metoxy-1,4-benzoquinol methylase
MSIHRIKVKKVIRKKPIAKPNVRRISNLDIIPIIKSAIRNDISTILDIGCGMLYPPFDAPGHDILGSCFAQYQITGIDACQTCIDWRLKNGPPGNYYLQDAKCLGSDQCFDLVVAHHVIEHMTKEDGQQLINKIEQIATKQIIIGAPIGFSDNSGMEKKRQNPYEKHLCGWEPEEFDKLGYKVTRIYNVFLATKDK